MWRFATLLRALGSPQKASFVFIVSLDIIQIYGLPLWEDIFFSIDCRYVTGMQDCISTSQIFRKLLVLTRDPQCPLNMVVWPAVIPATGVRTQ